MKTLILASGSPRRRELLEQAGIPYIAAPANADESVPCDFTPEQAVTELARRKALAAQKEYPEELILAADTLVALDGQTLGKPADEKEAEEMLRRLSGRTHEVFTGVAIRCGNRENTFFERTLVAFYELDTCDIEEYIKTGEPMDKAGAYGIQGRGCLFVRRLEGDYFNVVGLPIARVCRELKAFQAVKK